MSWFCKAKDKPKGIYRAQCWDGSCDKCAYQGANNYCNLRNQTITNAHKSKCADWMNKEAGIPEETKQ